MPAFIKSEKERTKTSFVSRMEWQVFCDADATEQTSSQPVCLCKPYL